jgi:hypothetical protein
MKIRAAKASAALLVSAVLSFGLSYDTCGSAALPGMLSGAAEISKSAFSILFIEGSAGPLRFGRRVRCSLCGGRFDSSCGFFGHDVLLWYG